MLFEMNYICTMINDYITYGYRVYSLRDFEIGKFISRIPDLARRYRLEIMVMEGKVYVKNTDKYDNKNPYM